VISESLEDLRNVVAMFSQTSGIYEDVIYVNKDEFMQKLSEYLVHEALEDCRGVDEPIGHDPIFVVPGRCYEGSLPFISLSYSD
jgi:hypothetical protein